MLGSGGFEALLGGRACNIQLPLRPVDHDFSLFCLFSKTVAQDLRSLGFPSRYWKIMTEVMRPHYVYVVPVLHSGLPESCPATKHCSRFLHPRRPEENAALAPASEEVKVPKPSNRSLRACAKARLGLYWSLLELQCLTTIVQQKGKTVYIEQ